MALEGSIETREDSEYRTGLFKVSPAFDGLLGSTLKFQIGCYKHPLELKCLHTTIHHYLGIHHVSCIMSHWKRGREILQRFPLVYPGVSRNYCCHVLFNTLCLLLSHIVSRKKSVLTAPGDNTLTRIFLVINSCEEVRARDRTAAFVAE
jgi:hypothetical protein